MSDAGVTVTGFTQKRTMIDVGVPEKEAKEPTLATLKRAIALWEGKAKHAAQKARKNADALQKIYDMHCKRDIDVTLESATSEEKTTMTQAGLMGDQQKTLANLKEKIKQLEKGGSSQTKKSANTLREIYEKFRQKSDAGVKLESATQQERQAMTEAGFSDDELKSLTLNTLQTKIKSLDEETNRNGGDAKRAGENAQSLQGTYNTCRAAAQQRELGPVIVRAGAAMAGVIARVDRERGVWKAPANVALVGVTELVSVRQDGKAEPIRLDDALNGRLVNNKINAIRAFHGQGIKVWGARTMADLNQTAWRYISVRRLFNAVERDARATLRTVVFEPNNAPTWEAVRSALDHYLFALWRKGALQGETPAQAYFVQIGLGVTMTPDDAANGRMIAKVGMAAVRPAEFIVLQFTQDMVPS
ncbi:phage tail sheath family protein [Mycetohabitans rhizoxinica]